MLSNISSSLNAASAMSFAFNSIIFSLLLGNWLLLKSLSFSHWSFFIKSFGKEPELTPILKATPLEIAFFTTAITFSLLPILPGLILIFATFPSIQIRARWWLKWISATRGIDVK